MRTAGVGVVTYKGVIYGSNSAAISTQHPPHLSVVSFKAEVGVSKDAGG
jgi:hypothetical protein